MTVKEAGEYIGRSPHVIYGLIAAGQFPQSEWAGEPHVAVKDLEGWSGENKLQSEV
jgi:hypothetical protein